MTAAGEGLGRDHVEKRLEKNESREAVGEELFNH